MVVVTMTSWIKRIYNVLPCLKGLMKQTYPADLIYLNLSKDEFTGMHIPDSLAEYINEHSNKIILNWVEGPNTKAFKKIFPILKYLKDDDIILDVDDDFVVPSNFIVSRINDFNRYKTSITGSIGTDLKGYADGLLPEMHHWFGAGSLFQKKMFNHWDELICDEIIATNHDDAFYGFLCWLNGYVPEVCTNCFVNDYEKCFKPSPSLHGSIGCANAITATNININIFKLKYKEEPCYNYFKTNNFNDEEFKYNNLYNKNLKFVMLDRGRKAGDNGEYFYRWLKENKPEIQISYILSKQSKDWDRLKQENFNLIDLSNTKLIQNEIDSADYLCFSYFPRDVLPGVKTAKIKKIFLNHGVFFRVLSYLKLREQDFDLMIVGNQLEYDELLNNYKIPTSKLALTGQPRHDSLINHNNFYKGENNNILIQFWWRPWFKNKKEDFLKSSFYTNVYALLNDQRLKQISIKYNINFLFKLHCEMEQYADLFKESKNIIFIKNDVGFEELFVKSKAIITDFTSNVYEMGIIDKPCIYFRPDWLNMKTELIKKDGSYFDVREFGIGPVTDTLDDFFIELEKLIKNDFKLDEFYLERREKQITFKQNANCCERVFNEIINLKTPVVQLPKTTGTNNTRKEKYSIQDFSFLRK